VFGSLRWGELAALRRCHIDLRSGTLRVEVSVAELTDGSLVTGPPKSLAGRRIVTLPAFVLPEVASHLDQFSGPDPDSLVFVGPKNAPLRRSNFARTWQRATDSAGLTGFHIHDLRHTGNHFAAATGASLRELMGRIGHSTTRAAVIYQHRTAERDRFIAAAMNQIIEAELANPDSPSGTRTSQCFLTLGRSAAITALTCGFWWERVTGIEPALSAWELAPSTLLRGPACGAGYPRVTVRDPCSPGLMAR
jgi:integrase-like protein